MTENFLEYLEVEKKYSPNTLLSYRKDLDDFVLFLQKTEGSSDVLKQNAKVLKNFIYYLSEQKIAKRSINRKISTLRSFYNFLLKMGEIKINPTENLQSLKFYPDMQMPISEAEMIFLRDKVYPEKADLMEMAIIETLYQTGMRKAELCNVQLADLDFSLGELRLHGKGNKERVIPVSEDLQKILKKYLQDRKPITSFAEFLFVGKNGKKLGEKFVYSVVNNYLSLITTKKKKSPHMLRHSFATHLLQNGAEISKVKKLMGHASLASTQVYTHADIEQLKKVFQVAHPRAKKK